MKRFLFILITILISNMSFAHEVTVTDLLGREVAIPAKVSKILAIGAGALRLIVYADAQHLVAGRELFEEKLDKSMRPYTYSIPKHYDKLPVVSAGGPGVMPDIHEIKNVRPDVIFANTLSADQLENIHRQTGIAVVGLTYGEVGHTDLEKIKESIRLIGYVTHTQQHTQAVLNKMAMLRKDLYARSTGQPKKSVYMASIAFKGAKGFTSTEKRHPSCQMLHITNIADSIYSPGAKGTHVALELASIIMKQPDFIFYDITGFDSLKANYADLHDSLTDMEAVKQGRVYSVMPYNWYNSNIENIFLTAYYIGKIVYPDRFQDVDIERVAHDIYNTFIRTDPFSEITEDNEVFKQMIFGLESFRFKE